jgi:triosephosphate isomerase
MNTKRKSEMQHKTIVGNWKMYTTAAEARELVEGILGGIVVDDRISVTLCPPFPYLALIGGILKSSRVALGAQNLYPKEEGAYTGEVSPKMLLDVGCKYVILGHSERRHKLGESDAFINQKVRLALGAGLDVILCVGETLEQRNSNQTEALLDRQIVAGLAGVSKRSLSCLSIAYEPVWAIGNAEHHATPEQAQEAHVIIRRRLGQLFDETSADAIAIQYGGSVKPDNAAAFLSRPGIDGALIGGASLHADEFLAIVRSGIDEAQIEDNSMSQIAAIKV